MCIRDSLYSGLCCCFILSFEPALCLVLWACRAVFIFWLAIPACLLVPSSGLILSSCEPNPALVKNRSRRFFDVVHSAFNFSIAVSPVTGIVRQQDNETPFLPTNWSMFQFCSIRLWRIIGVWGYPQFLWISQWINLGLSSEGPENQGFKLNWLLYDHL